MIRCCYGCVAPKRYPGCHGRCPEYLEEKAQDDREKAEINRRKRVNDGLIQEKYAGLKKAYKAHRRAKG